MNTYKTNGSNDEPTSCLRGKLRIMTPFHWII